MTSSQHNPDERDLLDFADAVAAGQNPQPRTDEERTYLHVHNTMQGESAPIPSTTKQSTWENVMSTLALTPEAPVSNRTRRQQGLSSPPPPPRSAKPRRMAWTPLASIAAAVLVVIASFGVWHFNQAPTEPPLAPQMAGITSGDDVAQVDAKPDAAAVVGESGNYSIPIIQHVDEQPMDGPVIWLTTSGDVMYDNGTEVQTLASDVKFVQPSMTNILMFTRNGEEIVNKDGVPVTPSEPSFYNLGTGETLGFTHTSSGSGASLHGQLGIRQVETAPNLWSVVNFDTMEWVTLNDLTGGQFPTSGTLSTSLSADGSAIAIASSQYQTESSSLLMQQTGLPGEIAVIPADLSEPTWVKVPDGVPPIGNMSLSQDGSKIALISGERFRGGSNMTIAVVDVETGDLLFRTQRVESSTFSHFQWVNDGNDFVIVADKTVQLYSLEGEEESEPTVIYETEGTLVLMPQIGESHLLHLHESSVDLATQTPTPETSQLVILNTDTQESVSIEGEPWFPGLMFPEQMTRSLAPIPVSKDGETAILVHPITEEVYPDLLADVYDPIKDPDFDPETSTAIYVRNVVTTADQAPTSAVALADGNLAVFDTTEDSFTARVIERPEGAENKQIQLSPAGDYLTIGATWETQNENDTFFMLNLTDPDSEWIQGEPGQMLAFIEIRED